MSSYPTPEIEQPIAPVRVSPGGKLIASGTDSKGRPMLSVTPDGSMDFAAIGKRAKQIKPEYADMDDATLGQKIMAKHPEFGQMLSTGKDIPAAVAQNPATAAHLLPRGTPESSQAPTPASGPSGVPVDAQGMPMPPPEGLIEGILRGAAKAGGRLAVGTADLLHHVIPLKALEATPAERASTVPSNTTERISGYGTDVALALAPGGAATKIARAAEAGPAATAAIRLALNSGLSGLWNKMEGGSAKTGAILGAGGDIAGMGASALAPRLMRSVIPGIDNATAAALLKNTSGFKPATIAASAEDAAPGVVSKLEEMAGHAGKTPVSTASALKVVDEAMKKAVNGNDAETMTHLREIRQRLMNTTVAGKSARPSEALHITNTLDNLAESLPSNAKTSYGPAQVASKAREALEAELEKAAPGSRATHDTVRALIRGGKAAKDAAGENPKFISNLARHAVYDMIAGVGAYGVSHSTPSALAASGLMHAATSPAARVAGARYLTPEMMNAIKAMLMSSSTPSQ